jgi:hypothetical protein
MSNKHSGAPVRLVVLNRQIEAAESMVTGSTKAVLGEGRCISRAPASMSPMR